MFTRRTVLATPLLAFGTSEDPALIPAPRRMTVGEGVFRLGPKTSIRSDVPSQTAAAALARALNCRLSQSGAISLSIDKNEPVLGTEGYRLRVTPTAVTIVGASAAGVYYGTQTLRQLLPPAVYSSAGRGDAEWTVPCLDIEDAPRFVWRGSLVDPARHFKPKASLLRYIDALAMHKVNILQIHLTDDQGWRIEIRKYPRLTEVGSVRKETRVGNENKSTAFDGTPHGGFYTQEDIREIVAYAAARHITVVPEIEMPGHAQSALAAYPEFGNTGEKLEVWTRWGVSKHVLGVSDKTFRFLEDILSEVLDLFPGKYIHVGGDEVPKDQWKASPEAQARIQSLGLKDETGLHTWFIGRINDFLRKRGRTLVGWGDIVEGGMTPGSVVMSWRDTKAGIEAARLGHDVVMAPHTVTYFDYYQAGPDGEPPAIGGMTTLDKVYNYEPVPPELTAAEARRVLGTQGHLWSEYLKTPEQMEYMAFPRMSALAEVMWTAQQHRDYSDFLRRLPRHLNRLKAAGVNYRPL